MVRRCKVDVLTELPRKRRQRIAISAEARAESTIALAQHAEERRAAGIEAQRLTGRDAWASHVQHNKLVMESWRATGVAKIVPAALYLAALLEGLGEGEKVLVFAHHKLVMDGMEAAVARSKRRFVRIDGTTPVAERHRAVTTFQTTRTCPLAYSR